MILAPQIGLACQMARALTETQFVIDPTTKRSTMESIKNNSQVEIFKCEPTSQFLLVNINALYFQDDTSRQESISGNLIQRSSNCSIQSEVPFQKMDLGILSEDVIRKNKFLRTCVKLVIGDARGMKLNIHPKSSCQYKAIDPEGTTVETDGAGCFVQVNAGSRILMETRVNPDCLDPEFLNQNQIQAGDYESVVKIWPAAMNGKEMTAAPPIGARYVRHTLLPAKGFMPRAVKEYEEHPSFISALSTNISPGNISFMSMGSERYQIQPTFLVENLAKDYCKDSQCAKVSSFVTPIAGIVKLNKFNPKNGKKNQIGEWHHALKIPGNWSGLAEFKAENNMSGLSMGALEADMKLNVGDTFELSAQFYEPRTLLDEMAANQEYMTLNDNIVIGEIVDDSLPELPVPGNLGKLDKLPRMPSVRLGYKGLLDLADQLNLKRTWSQKYDRVCNSQNMSCMKLVGLDKPLVQIKMVFKIGENKEVIPLSVLKKSQVFENYNQPVTRFAEKICQ